MKKIVVVGMSAASVAFVSKLRSFDQASKIICFSGEGIPYNRCLLADFLIQEAELDALQLKQPDFYERNNIELMMNTLVEKIDFENKKVFAQQRWFEYDILFLGMGSKPIVPQFVLDAYAQHVHGVCFFHTLADMQEIQRFVQQHQPKSALMIGAGLNGLEAAQALQKLGLTVGVVDQQQHVMARHVDTSIAGWVQGVLQQHAVALFLGHGVEKICYQDHRVTGVKLMSGATIRADLVVVSVGSMPNIDLLKDSKIVMHEGAVKVDRQLVTSIDGVFAAGDLCALPDFKTGQLVRSATWSDAMLQGLCAATTLSGVHREYQGVMNLRDSQLFEYELYACGTTIGHDAAVQRIEKIDADACKVWYVRDQKLIGFVLIGDVSKIAQYKMMYQLDRAVMPESFN